MSTEWHYSKAGQQIGPISSVDLKELATAGEIGPDDLVWNAALTEWVPANRVKGLTFVASTTSAEAVGSPAVEAQIMPADLTAVPAAPLLSYQSPSTSAPVPVTLRAIDLLVRTRPWVLVAAIIMFLWVGGMVIFGIVFMFLLASPSGRGSGAAIVGGVVYIALGLLFAAMPVYLTRYYAQIGNLKRLGRPADLENALDAQRAYWKYLGVITLLVIGLYLVIIIFAAAGGAMGWL